MSIMFPRVWLWTLLAFPLMTVTPCSGRRHADCAWHVIGRLIRRLDPKELVEICEAEVGEAASQVAMVC